MSISSFVTGCTGKNRARFRVNKGCRVLSLPHFFQGHDIDVEPTPFLIDIRDSIYTFHVKGHVGILRASQYLSVLCFKDVVVDVPFLH